LVTNNAMNWMQEVSSLNPNRILRFSCYCLKDAYNFPKSINELLLYLTRTVFSVRHKLKFWIAKILKEGKSFIRYVLFLLNATRRLLRNDVNF